MPKKFSKLRHLVIGMGQIGTAVYNTLKTEHVVFTRDKASFDDYDIDVLHICIPYSERFLDVVGQYQEQYDPMLVIVYSTVAIGTCNKLGNSVVHSPVEGKHPNLEESIRMSARWIGCEDRDASELAQVIWRDHAKSLRIVTSSHITEFLKLRSTAKYGVNLVWTDYEHSVSEALNIDFNLLKDFDSDYNELYKNLMMPEFQRYILDPPMGKIGGHCVIPNAKLLYNQFPNDMLKDIISMEDLNGS
jgi:hypothetical protein